jgi:hypothetical protein
MTSNILSGLAILVSVGALVVAWVYGHRSAIAADRSAKASEDSAADARKVRKAELEREHRDYAPQLNDLKFEWETNPRTKEPSQFLTFTLPRTYRVYGDKLNRQPNGGYSRSPIGGATGDILEAGTPQRLFISTERQKRPDEVELRFFPPAKGDPGETWSCPCDRDSMPAADGANAHWVVRLPVPARPTSGVRFI